MRITDYARCIASIEGKKKEVTIAQIMELLKIINDSMDGEFYKTIRRM